MALTTTSRDIGNNVSLEFYVTRTQGEDGPTYGILTDNVIKYDLQVLNKINDEGEGEDLQAKLETYLLPTNRYAISVYGSMIVNVDAYSALRRKKSGYSEEGNDLEAIVLANQQSISSLSGRVSGVEGVVGEVDALDGRVDSVEASVSSVEASVSGLTNSVGTLETSVGALETDVSNLSDSVSSVEGEVDALDGRVGSNETAIADLTGRVESLETATGE